jgi:hypothetical protein
MSRVNQNISAWFFYDQQLLDDQQKRNGKKSLLAKFEICVQLTTDGLSQYKSYTSSQRLNVGDVAAAIVRSPARSSSPFLCGGVKKPLGFWYR